MNVSISPTRGGFLEIPRIISKQQGGYLAKHLRARFSCRWTVVSGVIITPSTGAFWDTCQYYAYGRGILGGASGWRGREGWINIQESCQDRSHVMRDEVS